MEKGLPGPPLGVTAKNTALVVANRRGSKTANSTSKNFTFQQGNLWKSFENEYLTFHTFDDSQCSVQMKPNTCISSDIDCQEKKVQKRAAPRLSFLPCLEPWNGADLRNVALSGIRTHDFFLNQQTSVTESMTDVETLTILTIEPEWMSFLQECCWL